LVSKVIMVSKFVRSRRNALKAATLMGAFLSTSCLPEQAPGRGDNSGSNRNSGQSGNSVGNGQNGTSGQNGNSGQNSNSGGLCFAQGTRIKTRDGYRPIETLAAGHEVAVRSGSFAPIKAMVSHTVNSESGKWVGKSNPAGTHTARRFE
jgi:hypothetical protein